MPPKTINKEKMKRITIVIAIVRGNFLCSKKLMAGLQIIATNNESKKGTTMAAATLIPAKQITIAEKYKTLRAKVDPVDIIDSF